MAEVASTTPSVQVVGNAFVEQYYHVLHHSPDMVHKFYQDSSFISRPDEDGTMVTVTTMKGINEKICSLDYTAYKAEIKTADAQESFKDGVVVLVTGSLTRKEDNQRKKFIQSFFLAPQDKGFFVLNDVFRYVDDSNPVEDNQVVVEEITTSLIPEPVKEEIQHVEEEVKEVLENEKPLTNENNSVGPEQNQTENNISLVVESVVPKDIENAPKMSYASILSSQTKKGGPGPTKVYVPASKKTENKSVNIVTQVPPTEVSPAPISINSPDSSNVHDDGDGHSVYIRNLPLNATVPQLETEFKKFGPIKQGGIQVRSNKHLGFCFGFVEFQDAISMQNAIQNSPVVIGGKETIVEIKRTTTRVGSGRGRGGFRNDGFRPRGGFSGGRGYSNGGRSDYGGGRGEFSGRGRGGRGGEPYHHQGGRTIHYNSTTTTA